MQQHIHIHIPGCPAEPDPIRVILERTEAIMASLQELESKVAALTDQLNTQSGTIGSLRAYVTSIETAIADLASGETLSATVQGRVDALMAMIEANATTVQANQIGLEAAGDGDKTT